jgi:serine/threonine-protein kinase
MRLLAKRPEDRPASAAELVRELRELSTEQPDDGPAVGPAPAPRTDPAGPRLPESIYLAVLPFEDAGSSETPAGDRHRLFAGGLAHSVCSALARLPGVHVVYPTAAAEPTGPASLESTARCLGANLLLRGTVRRAGGRVRITWSLLDPFAGVALSGDTLDGSIEAAFALEDQLVRQVTAALGVEVAHAAPGRAPRDPAAHEHFLQALGYLQRYDNEASLDGAARLLERLLDTEGDTAAVHAALGRAYLGKYRLNSERSWAARAVAACERAVSLDPRLPEALVTLGAVHFDAGRHEESASDYRRALELDPKSSEALIGLSRALETLGRVEEAEVAARSAVASHPQHWSAHNWLGVLHFNHGHYELAVEPWRRVTEITPDNARAYSNLAATYFQLGRFDEAIAAGKRSLAIQPTARAYSNLGTVLFFLRRYPEASEAFERAAALTPNDPTTWGNLGSALKWIPERKAEARQSLERALSLVQGRLEVNPSRAEDWLLMSSWLADLGRGEEAAAAAEKALALAPQDVQCMAVAGVTYHQVGRRADALRWLEEALRGGYSRALLERDPQLSELRGDPEFERILREARAPSQGSGPMGR